SAEHPINVLNLDPTQGAQLLEGPKIDIVTDDNYIIREAVPIRALMVSCLKVHDLLDVKPRPAKSCIFGTLDIESVEALLVIFTTDKLLQTNEVNLVTSDFIKDIIMYKISVAFGICHAHTRSLLRSLCDTIQSRLLTRDELDSVVPGLPASGQLFKHHANHLSYQCFKGQIPDILGFH
ncbi:hypothetical protein BDW02DRAFT_623615, partial [Decorospora gaudefroyi]